MDINALLDQEKYKDALDQGGEVVIPLMVERFSMVKSNYALREALVKAGPAAIAPLSEKIAQAQPQVKLEMVRVLARINDPAAKDLAKKHGVFFKDTLRAYWKGSALSWWDHNNPTDASCDSCGNPIRREKAYYFVESRRLRCEDCVDGKLRDWDYSWEFFGKLEIPNALNYKPEPEKPRAPTAPAAPKYTLYAFEVRAAASGAPGFGTTVVMEADQSSLKELIRQRSNCMDAAVEIIPPEEWSPPTIASASMPAIQQAFQGVNGKVISYLKRCGFTNITEAQLIASGNVLPNPMSGRILFVYRLEGSPAKPKPAMQPSLAPRASAKPNAQKPAKKWWEFWK